MYSIAQVVNLFLSLRLQEAFSAIENLKCTKILSMTSCFVFNANDYMDCHDIRCILEADAKTQQLLRFVLAVLYCTHYPTCLSVIDIKSFLPQKKLPSMLFHQQPMNESLSATEPFHSRRRYARRGACVLSTLHQSACIVAHDVYQSEQNSSGLVVPPQRATVVASIPKRKRAMDGCNNERRALRREMISAIA